MIASRCVTSRLVAPRSQRGLSLLEILVALSLLGLMLGGLYGGLRTSLSAEEAVEKRIDAIEQVRISQEFLRMQLGAALPRYFAPEPGVRHRFEGSRDAIRFIGPLPGHLGRGGAHLQTFEFTSDDGALKLVFRHAPMLPDMDVRQTLTLSEPMVLVDGLVDAQFEFLLVERAGRSWDADWEDTDALPPLVRVTARFEPAAPLFWPDLVVVLRRADPIAEEDR